MAQLPQKIQLEAQSRKILGSKVRTLRRDGYVPAVLYGKNQESIPLQVSFKDFSKTFKMAGESTLIYVNVDGQSYPTIIHDVLRDSVKDTILHADFYKVRLDEKIKTNVPVVFVGEAPAVKDLGGIFVRNVNELEVEALPQNLPHELTIDISVLKNFGDKITMRDLKHGLGALVQLTAEEEDAIIAAVQEPMSEEELQASLEAPTVGVEDVEIIKKEKQEEIAEETPAEKAPATPEK